MAHLESLATRANIAIKAKGPVPIPNYAGVHFYNAFRVNGDSLQAQKSRRWVWITSNDANWLDEMLRKAGF